MSDRNANLSQAQQKFLMDRIVKAAQAKRPSWHCDAAFKADHPEPKNVAEANKAIERASKVVQDWQKKLEAIRVKRWDEVDAAFNAAKDRVLFGTADEARSAVMKFEAFK